MRGRGGGGGGGGRGGGGGGGGGGGLREPLLPAADVEAGAAARRAPRRSWIALTGEALRYIWPDTLALRARAVACLAVVVAVRVLNLAVPLAYKRVVDEFARMSAAAHPAAGAGAPAAFSFLEAFYPAVALYLGLWFFQGGAGGGGLLSNLRSYIYIPVAQASYRRCTLDVFAHILSLDHAWHLNRRTGELLRIVDRGTASMQTLLGAVFFNIGPALLDIAAATAFIALRLKAWIAAVVFVTLGAYIPLTIYLTEWRGKFRRDLNALDNARGQRAADALLNYETVKVFGNEALESAQYAGAVDRYQRVDYKLSASMALLNVAQGFVIFSGLAAGLVVCTQGVADGSLTVGDAVLFVTLMIQLYAPLNYFGSYYRVIQSSMMDMEGLFDLLNTRPTVRDAPDARPLAPTRHEVEFRGVEFGYAPGAPVLKGVSFVARGGKTTAFVGETGSGKSTVLRLLLRLCDPTAGAVLVDGQPLAGATQASLRAAIGVVPQDSVLFNDTIRYNVRYGRPGAAAVEVEAAGEAAAIAEAVRSRFPLGWETLVGERGLRLSGGEKQRVALARALLKDPPILVLDEATSALDSLTEQRIQETLEAKRADRTVLVVAHRLSTVVNADRIVVLEEGRVAEVGTHAELLAKGGLYAAMWRRQAEGHGKGGGAADGAADGASEVEGAADGAASEQAESQA
jgi:ATP-binding cassette subfamily B (MDR/TAP) protein 6